MKVPYADKNSPQALAFKERNRKVANERSRVRYAEDERYRETLKARTRKRYKEHTRRILDRGIEIRTQSDPRKILLSAAKQRAKSKGLAFEIGVEDISLITHCPMLGYELKVNVNGAKFDSFSLDRIDSNKGYVRGNVQMLSHKANTIKNNTTREELIHVLEVLAQVMEDHSDVSN